MYNITAMADSEVDALLEGTFGVSDVKTVAGADAFIKRVEVMEVELGWQSIWKVEMLRDLHNARAALAGEKAPFPAPIDDGPDYEGAILARQDARWQL